MESGSSASFFHTPSQLNHRPEDAPPAGNGFHFCISLLARWIDLGHRHLAMAIAEPDRIIEKIRLQFILIEPILPPLDSRVPQNVCAEGAKSVGGLGDVLADKHRKHQRVNEARSEDAVYGRVAVTAARKKARALHKIRFAGRNGLQ